MKSILTAAMVAIALPTTAFAAAQQTGSAARSYIADRADSAGTTDAKPPHQSAKAATRTRVLRLRLKVYPHGVLPRQPVTEFYRR